MKKSSFRILAWLPIAFGAVVSPVSGATTNVAFGGLSSTFRPPAITINAGDTVIWTGSGFHSVTGDTASEPLCGNAIPITGCTNTFMNTGTFGYRCIQHGSFGMVGTVIVQGNVPPSPVIITNARVSNGQFLFDHTANPGLSYVVENSTNLAAWSPVTTNTATSNSVQAADTFQVGGLRFYRVGRLPNP